MIELDAYWMVIFLEKIPHGVFKGGRSAAVPDFYIRQDRPRLP